MRDRHIAVYPGPHRLRRDADGTADTHGRQFAALQHAAHGAGGNIAQLAGGLVQVPEQGLAHAPTRA